MIAWNAQRIGIHIGAIATEHVHTLFHKYLQPRATPASHIHDRFGLEKRKHKWNYLTRRLSGTINDRIEEFSRICSGFQREYFLLACVDCLVDLHIRCTNGETVRQGGVSESPVCR